MTGFGGPVSWLLPLSSGVRESDFAHWTGSASIRRRATALRCGVLCALTRFLDPRTVRPLAVGAQERGGYTCSRWSCWDAHPYIACR